MPRKPRLALSVVAMVAVLTSLIIYFRTEERRDASEVTPKTLSADSRDGKVREDSTTAPHRSLPDGKFNSLESGYRWDQLNPGIATSKEDAQWLEAHGFPGPDAERYLMSLPTAALQDLANRGNKPAQAIYALRSAQAGNPQADTQEILLKSAASGSVYALKMAGDIYTSVDGYRDPVMASVYYGLQARRGDQAGFSQNYLMDSRMSDEQRFRAQVLRELMWRNIDDLRTQGGMRTLDSSPRPGLDEFLNQAVRPARESR